MAQLPRNSAGSDLFRRLNELQVRVRQLTAAPQEAHSRPRDGQPVVSGSQANILARLRDQSPQLADSLTQAIADLDDASRKTYIGAAGEAREVMRAAIQLYAPEEEVKKQSWFKGVQQGGQTNATQAERLRYAVQARGGDYRQANDAVDMIDERIGRLGRQVYQRASSAFHSTNQRQELRKLIGWVFAVLDEVLPE